jgi:hypothetical protein
MAFENLTNWARDNLKRSEILEMIEELQSLVKSRKDDDARDDELPNPEAVRRERTEAAERGLAGALDSRRRGHISTAKAEAEFLAMFPDAGRVRA